MDSAFPANQSQQAVADAPNPNPADQQGLAAGAGQDGATPTEPTTDAAAELARLQAEHQQTQTQLETERQARLQSEQIIAAQQRQVAETAARQWRDDEQALLASDEVTPEQLAGFYRNREQWLLNQHQQVVNSFNQERQQTHQERVYAFASHIAKESGLAEQDAQALLMTPGAMQNPNLMVQAAQTLKQSRDAGSAETKRLQTQIDYLTRQITGNGMKPAWQTGGANGAAPVQQVKPGSEEGFRNALRGFGDIR